jgi:hypothetical protein
MMLTLILSLLLCVHILYQYSIRKLLLKVQEEYRRIDDLTSENLSLLSQRIDICNERSKIFDEGLVHLQNAFLKHIKDARRDDEGEEWKLK